MAQVGSNLMELVYRYADACLKYVVRPELTKSEINRLHDELEAAVNATYADAQRYRSLQGKIDAPSGTD